MSGSVPPKQRHAIEEYPFDAHLLALSPLYRRSRALYLAGGGKYRATLVSAARTLSSPILVENTIEYTPLAREFFWAASDPIERKNTAALTALKRFTPSLFHEQNHRILWKLLPPAPTGRAALRRYLNFAESLVITTDMALGDELGPNRAMLFHRIGLTYDPGTDVRQSISNPRTYRNYLQACLHATYLNLEVFDSKLITKVIAALYSNLEPRLLKRAVTRAANLNRGFITRTNLLWQRKHYKSVVAALAHQRGEPLALKDHPLENIEQYKIAERWFDLLKLR